MIAPSERRFELASEARALAHYLERAAALQEALEPGAERNFNIAKALATVDGISTRLATIIDAIGADRHFPLDW